MANKRTSFTSNNSQELVPQEDFDDDKDQVDSAISTTIPVAWSPDNEKIVVEWCDIAKCYKWLHTRSHQKFSRMHAWFTIPAIILSTISGTASFAQGSLPVSMQTFAPMVIGSVNIFIGILTTIQQYLKISEYNESHRVSAIAWDKFARNIRIVLAKHPDERDSDAGHFLKVNGDEFDRMMETSPSIPISVTAEFLEIFSGDTQSWLDCCSKKKKAENKLKMKEESKKKALMFEKLKKPDVCNIIITADDDRHPWYKDANLGKIGNNEDIIFSAVSQKMTKMQEDLKLEYERKTRLEKENREKEEIEKKRKNDLQQKIINYTETNNNKIKEQTKKIEEYVKSFSNNHGRFPLKDEIHDGLNSKIDYEILTKYLLNYKTDSIHFEIDEEDMV
jgi:hypothetical protein